MNKWLCGMAGALIAQTALAQDAAVSTVAPQDPITAKQQVVWADPLAASFGVVALKYERSIAERWSFVAAGNMRAFAVQSDGFTEQAPVHSNFMVGDLGVGGGVNRYLTGSSLDGVFLGARAGVTAQLLGFGGTLLDEQGEAVGESSFRSRAFGPTAEVLAGYTLVHGSGLSAQLGLGVGVAHLWRQTSGGATLRTRDWYVAPLGQFSLGWAF